MLSHVLAGEQGVSPGRVKWLCEKLNWVGVTANHPTAFMEPTAWPKEKECKAAFTLNPAETETNALTKKVETKQKPRGNGVKKKGFIRKRNVGEFLVL